MFSLKDNIFVVMGITKTGNEIAVFATIIAMFNDWREKHPKTTFYFSAKEPSRIKLYDRFAKILVKKFHYKLSFPSGSGGEKVYKFEK